MPDIEDRPQEIDAMNWLGEIGGQISGAGDVLVKNPSLRDEILKALSSPPAREPVWKHILLAMATKDPLAMTRLEHTNYLEKMQGLAMKLKLAQMMQGEIPMSKLTEPEMAPQEVAPVGEGKGVFPIGATPILPTGRLVPSLSSTPSAQADIERFLKGRAAPKRQIEKVGETLVEIPSQGPARSIFTAPPKVKEPSLGQEAELWRGVLREELGKEPTITQIQQRMKQEAKGYETEAEALAVSQRMVASAGENAALLPGIELTKDNKWAPRPQPDISKRIPPYMPAPNIPFVNINRKTGKYQDPFTQKDMTRGEAIQKYGEGAAINADRMALGELTKREQLIKSFTNRIDANVPIVLDAVKKVKNTNMRLYNEAINKSKQFFVGSGEWQALQTAMLSLSNEVQRVESNSLGIGGQGQEERKVWAKIHDPNMSFKDIETLAHMIQRLSKTATNVIEKQRLDLINRIPEEAGMEVGVPSTTTAPKENLRKKYNY